MLEMDQLKSLNQNWFASAEERAADLDTLPQQLREAVRAESRTYPVAALTPQYQEQQHIVTVVLQLNAGKAQPSLPAHKTPRVQK
jgi:hypothetical protein